jgi:hypothetical protein
MSVHLYEAGGLGFGVEEGVSLGRFAEVGRVGATICLELVSWESVGTAGCLDDDDGLKEMTGIGMFEEFQESNQSPIAKSGILLARFS